MPVYMKNLAPQLGNSLFQIAAGLSYSIDNNEEFVCPLWGHAKYFNHAFKFGSPSEILYTVSQIGFDYNKLPFNKSMLGKNICVDCFNGYFQSEKFFAHNSDSIKSHFSLNFDMNVPEEYCSIHIRRTDYLPQPQYHPAMPESYYKKAIEMMIDKGVNEFIICSDDVSWASEVVAPICKKYNKKVSVSTKNYIEDFYILTQAKWSIMANSSFSWMGAWLAGSDVICPKKEQWFGPAYHYYIMDDLIPERWTQLGY